MVSTGTKQSWARGGLIFAGTLMMLIGVYQFFLGIAAILQDDIFVAGPNYTYRVDTTAWGWIHLGIGVLCAVAGFFLFTGATWAKVVGIAMASISAIANFFFLPYYPVWSLLIIAVDVFAIWAIATARSVDEFEPEQMAMGTGAGFAGESAQGSGRWPQENVAAGRHWAPEDVKPGMGQPATDPAQQARERAEAAARGGSGGGTYTAGPSGVTPPPDEPRQP
jgi:hypothetical protein